MGYRYRYGTQGTGYRIQDTRYRTHDTRDRRQETGYKIQIPDADTHLESLLRYR